jgi:hypothetical protein
MQKLDLNLSGNPFRNNVLLWVGYGTAIAVLLVFSLSSVTTYFDYRSRLADLRDTVGNFESRRLSLQTRGVRALTAIRAIDIEALELQARMANRVIERKAFSWTKLFNSIERMQPNQIRMTSVRPIFSAVRLGASSAAGGVAQGMPVGIEGLSKTFLEFTELERALQEDPHFGRVLPLRLSKTDDNEILFQVTFDYYPDATPVEPEAAAEAPEEQAIAVVEGPAPDPAADGEAATEGPDAAAANDETQPGAPDVTPSPAGQRPARGRPSSPQPEVAPAEPGDHPEEQAEEDA